MDTDTYDFQGVWVLSMDSPLPLVVVKPICPSQVEHLQKGTTNTSAVRKKLIILEVNINMSPNCPYYLRKLAHAIICVMKKRQRDLN